MEREKRRIVSSQQKQEHRHHHHHLYTEKREYVPPSGPRVLEQRFLTYFGGLRMRVISSPQKHSFRGAASYRFLCPSLTVYVSAPPLLLPIEIRSSVLLLLLLLLPFSRSVCLFSHYRNRSALHNIPRIEKQRTDGKDWSSSSEEKEKGKKKKKRRRARKRCGGEEREILG